MNRYNVYTKESKHEHTTGATAKRARTIKTRLCGKKRSVTPRRIDRNVLGEMDGYNEWQFYLPSNAATPCHTRDASPTKVKAANKTYH